MLDIYTFSKTSQEFTSILSLLNFTVIENLVGKIDSYEIGEENKYRVILKNNQEVDIKFNNYNQFTLFSLDVD